MKGDVVTLHSLHVLHLDRCFVDIIVLSGNSSLHHNHPQLGQTHQLELQG